jgi:hypothetical protein
MHRAGSCGPAGAGEAVARRASDGVPAPGPPPPVIDPSARLLAGIDFTSRPTRRKPITVAIGRVHRGVVELQRLDTHADFEGLSRWLQSPGPWLGVFDLPFGLPRELVTALGWPLDWSRLMQHYGALSRQEIRATFAAFCAGRPSGAKFAHRSTDRPAGSSPSMKWVNPPVAYMMHAGVPLLLHAGVQMPGLHAGDPARVALEGYPGLLAREILGSRSYKSDDRAKQTTPRLIARIDLVDALGLGRTRLQLRLKLSHAQREELIADAAGDRLDAVLCLMQAAWAASQPDFGMPHGVDPLEGWIVSA